jgi:hypothetical protein
MTTKAPPPYGHQIDHHMRTIPIQGLDITEATPSSGKIFVAGLIRSPRQIISIRWESQGCSGSTECEAWRGQHEIDRLTIAGHQIKSVGIA